MSLLIATVLLATALAPAQQAAKTIPPPPDVAAPPADAGKTASGLTTIVITPGAGRDHPTAEDLVRVHYTGWKTDGTMFDSSVASGKPVTFPVNRVIAGFSEGLKLKSGVCGFLKRSPPRARASRKGCSSSMSNSSTCRTGRRPT